MRVLVIDDDPALQRTIERMLVSAGFAVSLAADGRAGVALFRAAPHDLVITDILMPEQEGVETILELRRLVPALPILAISGGGNIGDIQVLKLASQLGATETLEKPFTRGGLLETVKKCLSPAEAAF